MKTQNPNKKVFTLCLCRNKDSLLLGMKKRGFGEGKWNGFGGKLLEGETIVQAAKREVREETGLEIDGLEEMGILNCEFENDPLIGEVHIFKANSFKGDPIETEEMKPSWFKFDEIPFDSMWPDEKIWIPLFLENKRFAGKIFFKDKNTIISHNIKET